MSAVVSQALSKALHRGPLAEILAEHAPYLSRRSDNKLCLRCLDTDGHGEFLTIDDWAAHVAAALTEAGWVRKRR
jgi:hypothetical protein